MARDIPTSFTPAKIMHYGPQRPIRDGTASAVVGEVDLANNINYLWGYHTPQIVNQICNHNIGTQADSPGWHIIQAQQNSGDVLLGFYLPMLRKWSTNEAANLVVRFYARMDTGTNEGSITAKLHHDNVSASVNVAAHNVNNSFAWYRVELAHDDNSVTEDKLLISVAAGSGGEEVQLHSVAAYWAPYPDATVQDGGAQHDGFLPFDSQEFDQNSPLSSELRSRMFENIERIRKNRSDVIWSFSDTPIKRFGTESVPFLFKNAFTESYVCRIPFRSKPGQTKIRWAALLQKNDSSTDYQLRIKTTHQVAESNGNVDVGSVVPHGAFVLASSWDYAGSDNSFIASWVTHATYGELDCFENALGEILITIKSPAAGCAVKGFTAWFKEIA